jgi:predicted TIM-barrel fold metal-dependent hydrolase
MTYFDARVRLPQEFRESSSYQSIDTDQYDKLLSLTDKINNGTLDALLASMDANDISKAIMHAETEGGESADHLNSALHKVISEHSKRFFGIGTVDVQSLHPATYVRQINEIKEYGFIGVTIQPAFFNLDINDKILYPLYSKAEEMNLSVGIHTGITYSRKHKLSHEKPELLDQVACDFPDLKIIASHSGWPWATEMAAVASRHPTVFLEFGAIAPKYVSRPGTGWDTLFSFMPNRLQGQILYGSDWPMMSHERSISEWKNSGLNQETMDCLMFENALKLIVER